MNRHSISKKLILFGCGGHARSIVNAILKSEKATEILLVDKNARENEIILGCRAQNNYQLEAEDRYIIAIGDNQKRKEIYNRLELEQIGESVTIISNNACIGLDVKLGKGTFIAANAYVGPEVSIGDDTIINTSCVVEHEVVIGCHSHIAPNATVCGRAVIGNEVFCGAGSTVIDGVHICDHVIIGAGAVVKENIIVPGTYVGVPARRIK